MHPQTQNPIVDGIIVAYLFGAEILSAVIVISISGAYSTLSFLACGITILLGLMNLTIVYPKFKEQIKKSKLPNWIKKRFK